MLSPSELERQRRCLHKFDALMRSSQGFRRVKQTPGGGARTWESRKQALADVQLMPLLELEHLCRSVFGGKEAARP